MSCLLLPCVVVSAIECVLPIEIGRRIGTLPTLSLIVITGALGACLAHREGLSFVQTMREVVAGGRIPAAPIIDGITLLITGAVLMTPGVMTDAFGFFGALRAWV